MVPYTRRRLLHVVTAGLGGIAGCGRLAGEPAQSTQTVAANGGSNESADGTETDPPTVLLRADSETPPIRPPGFEQAQTDSPRREGFSSRITNTIVGSRSDAERLTVADGVDSGAVSAFVSETDFGTETLYLETNRVQECYRLVLCYVSWWPDEIETDYVRKLRPYDEHCSADDAVFESRLVRLPVALDGDAVNSFASSIGAGRRCDRARAARAEGSSGRNGSANTPRTLDGRGRQ